MEQKLNISIVKALAIISKFESVKVIGPHCVHIGTLRVFHNSFIVIQSINKKAKSIFHSLSAGT